MLEGGEDGGAVNGENVELVEKLRYELSITCAHCCTLWNTSLRTGRQTRFEEGNAIESKGIKRSTNQTHRPIIRP